MHKELIPFQNAYWSDVEKGIKQQILSEIFLEVSVFQFNPKG